MGLRIIVKSKNIFQEIQREINIHESEILESVNSLGRNTLFQIKEVIQQGKKRPQNTDPTKLENAITIEYFNGNNGKFGWGVGAIDKLNQQAPYWRAINYGSSHLVGKVLPLGEFSPDPEDGRPNDAHFRQGRWYPTGKFFAKIKRPIPPMNFIEKTLEYVRSAINKIKPRIVRG